MNKLLEKFEGLFYVRRKEPTYRKALFTLTLVLITGFSLPIYLKYEDYSYGKYKEEYNSVVEIVQRYKDQNEEYPIGNIVNWDNEEDLNMFFKDNNLSRSSSLYYIDINILDELKDKKYTYIIDIEKNNMYTSEFVVYNFRRWHFPFY